MRCALSVFSSQGQSLTPRPILLADRDQLKLNQQEFQQAPLPVVGLVVLGGVLCLAGAACSCARLLAQTAV